MTQRVQGIIGAALLVYVVISAARGHDAHEASWTHFFLNLGDIGLIAYAAVMVDRWARSYRDEELEEADDE